MWTLRYTILLLCIIDDRNYISANAIDLLSFNNKSRLIRKNDYRRKKKIFISFKDEILNTIEHRVQIGQNHDRKKWDMNGSD